MKDRVMKNWFWILLLVFINVFHATASSTEKLRNLTKGYDKRSRPFSKGGPTNVSVQIAMIALGPISEKTLTMKSDVFIRQWWVDERLETGKDQLNFAIDPTEFFWVPDTFVSNARKTESHQMFTQSVKTQIGPYGRVYASKRFTINCHCKMNLKIFPHDIQECSIDIESYAFSGKEISLFWKDPNFPIDASPKDLATSGYEVLSIKGKLDVMYYLKVPFPKLRAVIRMKRSFPYFLYHVYIPGALLVGLSFTTFFIPPTAVPARVTLIVTNFLSTMFIFGSTSSLIPKEPYITAMEIYSLVNIVFIIMVMFEYILVLKIKSLKGKKLPNPATLFRKKDEIEMQQRHLNGNDAELLPVRSQKPPGGNILDTFAKVLFPLSYILFLIVYFVSCTTNE
ncbi:gamma-aminobutyric acid receptor subunit rho-3-like isoform X2 [Rhopilema esculentum]|uniref:gamma-aminobutyric acid receptor subunit rho-3-like isoform X2 n=1 Tax=Rhopilema esculentum TaxID=499914 RepID=UPI0031D9BE87